MRSFFIVACLHVLFTGVLIAEEPAWRELATGGYSGAEDVFATKLDRLVATIPDGDADTLAGRALVRATAGNSHCELTRCEGQGGAIALGETGTHGPFLAIYWDTGGAVWAAWRAADDAPLQQLPLGKVEGNEVRIHFRDGVLYSYIVDPGGLVEPLVAVELDLGEEPLLGVLSLGDFSCDQPRMGGLPATLAHTFDLDLGQAGTELSASWEAKEAPSSVNGSYLFHASGGGDASARVTVSSLYEGSYDLWMSDHPSEEAPGELNVVVEGSAGKSAFAISQQFGKGVWLGLGRYEVLRGERLSVDFRRPVENAAPVSLDAVHLLWSEWQDEDRNALPDDWEAANSALTRAALSEAAGTELALGTHPLSSRRALPGVSETSGLTTHAPGKGLVEGDRIVLYVDANTGDDHYDGRAELVQVGPWHSTRTGPLRTLQKALDSIGDARNVELRLSGSMELPPGGFQSPERTNFYFTATGHGDVFFTSGTEQVPPPPPLLSPAQPDSRSK